MNDLNEIVNLCLVRIKVSSDFNDGETINAFKQLLSAIIAKPRQLVDCFYEENLSLVLSSIMTSPFPQNYPIYEGMNVRNTVFACAYYLYMHQLETGYFYDRNWPAFLLIMHLCHYEFAKCSIYMNPFAPERVQEILGKEIDYTRLINAAKGVELNMMLTARKKGFLTEEIQPWFEELYKDYDNLLANCDPFTDTAIPLYRCIGNYLKENDLTFVQRV